MLCSCSPLPLVHTVRFTIPVAAEPCAASAHYPFVDPLYVGAPIRLPAYMLLATFDLSVGQGLYTSS